MGFTTEYVVRVVDPPYCLGRSGAALTQRYRHELNGLMLVSEHNAAIRSPLAEIYRVLSLGCI